MQASQATPPASFAGWLDDTNDITRAFLAAGQIPGLINIAGGLPDPQVYPVDALSEIAARNAGRSEEARRGAAGSRFHVQSKWSTQSVEARETKLWVIRSRQKFFLLTAQ